MGYAGRQVDITDEIDWDDGDVADVLRDYAENAAQGFGPYCDDKEGLKSALYKATIQKSSELESEVDDLERQLSALNDKIAQLDSTYDHEVNTIVDEAWDEFFSVEEEEDDEEDAA